MYMYIYVYVYIYMYMYIYVYVGPLSIHNVIFSYILIPPTHHLSLTNKLHKLSCRNYTLLLNAAAFWLQPAFRNVDVFPYCGEFDVSKRQSAQSLHTSKVSVRGPGTPTEAGRGAAARAAVSCSHSALSCSR